MAYRYFFQPEHEMDVPFLVEGAHKAQKPLRVMGSGLSPNGLSFCKDAMLSMALLDKVCGPCRQHACMQRQRWRLMPCTMHHLPG